MFLISIISCLFLISFAEGSFKLGSVYVKDGKASFLPGYIDKDAATAYGLYNDTMYSTGWGVLDIKAGHGKKAAANNDMMYAAGFLEGVLTGRRIYQHYINVYDAMITKNSEDFILKLKAFYNRQESWAKAMIAKDKGKSPLWRHVGYVMAQFDGLYSGCQLSKQPISRFMLQFLNGVGDLLDLKYVLDRSLRPDFSAMSDNEFETFVRSNGHCSALVKATSGYENLFMSHSSWFSYSAMLRIYKHYDFNLNDPSTAAKAMSFSSYPGFLESLDDFYLLSSGLVMLQTTNNIFNHSLYDQVNSSSLLSWQRVRVANLLAASAPEWGEIFKQYNSGTYNNQYMIIDLSKIKLRKTIEDNALWVVEQIPGLVENQDQTNILRMGFWSSYNVPFFESIYNKSGYPEVVQRRGYENSHMLAPRAKIFRRDSDKVDNMQKMMNIMRYNDYKNDIYSAGDPCKTICCRGDLKSPPSLDGCYDTKVSDYNMALKRESYSVNGPSPGNNLGAFSWSHFKATHIGMPQTFNFDFVHMKPSEF